jgi:hypothetical protein
MDDDRDMNKLMGDAVAKFVPQRHRNTPSMPEPGIADKLAVIDLIEAIETDHKRIGENIQKIRQQLTLAGDSITAASEQMINAIRTLNK